MGDRLAGKVCIVTGSAQGIGAAYIRALAAEGADVAIVDLKRIDQAQNVHDDSSKMTGQILINDAGSWFTG